MEREVDNQVAAPAETRTPNLHRANNRSLEECGWKGGDSGDSAERKSCLTNTNHRLDSDRPSHGRRLHSEPDRWCNDDLSTVTAFEWRRASGKGVRPCG